MGDLRTHKTTEQVKTLNVPLGVLQKTENSLDTLAFKACASLNVNAHARPPCLRAVHFSLAISSFLSAHRPSPAMRAELEGSLAPPALLEACPQIIALHTTCCAHLPRTVNNPTTGVAWYHTGTSARRSSLPPRPPPPPETAVASRDIALPSVRCLGREHVGPLLQCPRPSGGRISQVICCGSQHQVGSLSGTLGVPRGWRASLGCAPALSLGLPGLL